MTISFFRMLITKNTARVLPRCILNRVNRLRILEGRMMKIAESRFQKADFRKQKAERFQKAD
jgi:hypothetical protein